MKNYNEVKQAYSEILEAVKKHEGVCVFDFKSLEKQSKCHLFGLELKEVYGLNIDPKRVEYNYEYYKHDDYRWIGLFGEKHRRTISWSVDGRQPEDEMLLCISFCTGAYIFGEDYPVELFQKFWLELKSFKPDYTDEANHSIYFSLDNAKEVFNSFDSIIKKYYELNKEDFKQRKIKALQKELEKLTTK